MKLQKAPVFQQNTQQTQQPSTMAQPPASTPKTNQVAFKGVEGLVTGSLNYFQTNQAWGAALVDLFSMVIPRTVIDYTRSKEAGNETLVRESSSAVNDALVGGYGLGAAYFLSKAFNKDFGVSANKMFISNDMIDITGAKWDAAKTDKNPLNKFLHSYVDDIEAFNPQAKGNEKGWIKLSDETKKAVVEKLETELSKENITHLDKKAKQLLSSMLSEDTGVVDKFRLAHDTLIKNEKGEKLIKYAEANAEELLSDVGKLTCAFKKGTVAKEFAKEISNNSFINRLKHTNKWIALVGIGACTAVGMSVQPINMYLTKKRTGKEGFVGGGEVDKSGGFKLMKLAVGAAAMTATIASIVGKPIKNFKKLPEAIQFKGFSPTINQFKLIYGATITSRLIASRSKEELAESSVKDTLGFANWLILGGFISKLTAMGLEEFVKFKDSNVSNTFVRYNKDTNKPPKFKNGEIISRKEVLFEALKGKLDQLNGKEANVSNMMDLAKKLKLTDAIKKVRLLAIAQFAGYIYSGVVLGIGIPKLNIAMNNFMRNRREAKAQEQAKAAA